MAMVSLSSSLSGAVGVKPPRKISGKTSIFSHSRRRFLKRSVSAPSFHRIFPAILRASSSSTATIETKPDSSSNENEMMIRKNVLACPICFNKLIWNGDPGLSVDSAPRSSMQCSTCKKAYYGNETHLDLTVAGGSKVYGEYMPVSTELFRTPFVSFLYERGWRQTFSAWGGFPGPEKEFELMKDYLKPALGGNIVDASCGSGMFSRLFAKSGLFSFVVGLDFSENMLRQCFEFIQNEDNFPKENLILVRADISRLPFSLNTVDAVHAGAALHCWPSPSAGASRISRMTVVVHSILTSIIAVERCMFYVVAEISRVLKPGGVFVATTYILDGPLSFIPLLGPLRQNIGQISGSHIFLSDRELEDLCTVCGLVDFKRVRNRGFIMISARKPT